MLLSIITINRNDAKGLKRTLESVMNYDKYAGDMRMMDRIRKHQMYPLVYFIERVLFKLEKWHVLK